MKSEALKTAAGETGERPWDTEGVTSLLKQLFPGGRLVVAANRAPYLQVRSPHGPRWLRPAGGLASALDPVMQAAGGLWVSTAVIAEERAAGEGLLALPPAAPRYWLKRVGLTREEMNGYYLGYANGGLWPLCHMLVERARFSVEDWQAYATVNRRLAGTIAAAAGPADFIWLHDYHLALCPEMIKERLPAATVALFWHIPWPPYDIFRLCPQRRELLEGMLGCDLIGFQTGEFARNFLDCAARELGADVRGNLVLHRGRRCRTGVFPISVDYHRLAGLARSPGTERRIQLLSRILKLNNRALGLGVDRLDYTKGIIHRLRGIDTFFERYPRYHGRVNFIQVAVPSRVELEPYRRLRIKVERLVRSLNRRIGTGGWKPIHYIDRLVGPQPLVALYRLADFALISSLYDGMNLVAKEFSACQVERPGTLLISETAGVCGDLPGVRRINPLDPGGMAEAIREAVEMPPEQRRQRVSAQQAHLAEHNIYKWAADIIRAAAAG